MSLQKLIAANRKRIVSVAYHRMLMGVAKGYDLQEQTKGETLRLPRGTRDISA